MALNFNDLLIILSICAIACGKNMAVFCKILVISYPQKPFDDTFPFYFFALVYTVLHFVPDTALLCMYYANINTRLFSSDTEQPLLKTIAIVSTEDVWRKNLPFSQMWTGMVGPPFCLDLEVLKELSFQHDLFVLTWIQNELKFLGRKNKKYKRKNNAKRIFKISKF